MSEETNERYALDILPAAVWLYDTKDRVTVKGFYGPARLLAATAELNRLNDREELGAPDIDLAGTFSSAPGAFLAETLPAKARRQRLEAHLREVREHEGHLARVLAADAANLKRATALREKLEKELASPLSATLPEAPQRAPWIPGFSNAKRRMSRPGPY